MMDVFETVTASLGSALALPDIGVADFFAAVLVACGLATIALASLLPKGKAETLEWWER